MRNFKLLFVILLLFSGTAFAQFGKNKVQYKNFDWFYIQTDHFDIYFTNGGETITEFAAHAAEKALSSIQKTFRFRINNRITLIVYNSQNDFQETNVIDQSLSEGIQGFTELFKNRVVVQFNGSYSQFRHLIHHELVHAVMNDMFYGGSLQNIIANNISLTFPLWFSEGLAEFEALGWDVDTDMFIREAAISEYLPDINRLGGYFAYRGGQSVFYYIANKYGKEKIGELLNKIKGLNNVNEAIKSTLGLEIKELNERWRKDIKRTYWPDVALREDPEEFSKRLTDPEKNDGFYNTSPAISPQGDKIAFITNRNFYFDVYLMNAVDGKIIKRLVEGNRTPDFEELNILTPGLTWSPDGTSIALSAKSKGYDVIYVINVETEKRKTLPVRLEAIQSVTWSNKGRHLAFVGQNKKQSDVYLFDLETNELTNLTDDIFTDSDPAWSFDDTKIYFASDRGSYLDNTHLTENFKIYEHEHLQTDIYSINLKDNKIARITDLPFSNETSPREDANGNRLIFISDLNGINNIYVKDLNSDSDSFIPITNSITGLYQLSTSKDSKKLVYSTLYKASFNLFLMNNPFEPKTDLESLEPTKYIAKLTQARERKTDEDSEEELVQIFDDSVDTKKTDILIFTGNVIDTSKSSSEGLKDDFSNFIFGKPGDSSATDDEALLDSLKPKDNLDENGDFIVNRYKISFAPDLVYANAGYNTIYGLIGTTIISFSDVLGNHRLIGVTGLQIDLKNSDFGLAYYYLPDRINLGFQGFHTARFVRLIRGNFADLFRFRNYGAAISANFPLNTFYRFEAGINWFNVRAENLDDISEPVDEANFFVPSLSFVHDNVLWGYTSPIEGTRYRLDLYGNPGINSKRLSFYTLAGDYRTYLRFWTDYSFVMRFSTGYSGGANAQRFFLGGTENWINRTFATTEVPLESVSDFAFLTAALPLRGYDYAERIGTKYALINYELRFPLIRYLVPGALPILFSNILGVAYIDAGAAWNQTEKLKLFARNENGNLISKDLLIGTGLGARLYLLYFLVRFDVAWAYNFDGFSSPRYYFSLGADF
ncbi:MAG: PD40 domain-containing protein [Ignavibacterium sp.]|nr:PD40 domain-containing protein [Ignavibacterium sp.]